MKLKYKRCVAALAFLSMIAGAFAAPRRVDRSIKLTCRHGKYLATRHLDKELLAPARCYKKTGPRINCMSIEPNTPDTCKLLKGYGKLATLHCGRPLIVHTLKKKILQDDLGGPGQVNLLSAACDLARRELR